MIDSFHSLGNFSFFQIEVKALKHTQTNYWHRDY